MTELTPINITQKMKDLLLESMKWTNLKEYGKTLQFLLNESPTYIKIKKKMVEDKEFIKNAMEEPLIKEFEGEDGTN